jgi:hypothetical protein
LTGLLLILFLVPRSRGVFKVGIQVIAPLKEDGCLYPGTVLGAEKDKALVRFDFGEEAWITTDNMYLHRAPSLSELKLNVEVYVRLEAEGVWVLGQIKDERDGKQLVRLNLNAVCRGDKTHRWATVEDILLRK